MVVTTKSGISNEIQPKQIQQIQCAFAIRKVERFERLEQISEFFKRDINSTKELTFIEAEDLIYYLNTGKRSKALWAFFDDSQGFASQRKALWSFLYQANWTIRNASTQYVEVPDLEQLSNFLKSNKSPVNKPLKQFNKKEWSKIIECFKGIVKSKYK